MLSLAPHTEAPAHAWIDTTPHPLPTTLHHFNSTIRPPLTPCPSSRSRSRSKSSSGFLSVDAAVALASSWAGAMSVTSKILPGFMSQCGSRARLMLRITFNVSEPSSLTREPFLPRPMPCSPWWVGGLVAWRVSRVDVVGRVVVRRWW